MAAQGEDLQRVGGVPKLQVAIKPTGGGQFEPSRVERQSEDRPLMPPQRAGTLSGFDIP